ncbi:hypothetical protein BJ912DRAFT_1025317 [Pholiota molesta]|nr:hypothetical protein BJ912DRAFT_1025317 [Pholiota molesta]
MQSNGPQHKSYLWSPRKRQRLLSNIDEKGFGVCPDCGSEVNTGTVGVQNIEKRHRGSAACKKAQQKQDKAASDAKKKKTTIFSFWSRVKTTAPVPSTIQHSAPVYSNQLHPSNTLGSIETVPVQDKIMHTPQVPIVTGFLETFRGLIDDLPESIPEASQYDKLAVFGGDPRDSDNPSLDADELWEEVLNQLLKSALGWGTEEGIEGLIRRGRNGLEGLYNFAKYFIVKRGVSKGLFEGKLSHLMAAMRNLTPSTRPKSVVVETIDLEAFEFEDTLQKTRLPDTHTVCSGYTLVFPNGQSPYTAYTFALHDTLTIPWVPHITPTRTMTLFSRSCCQHVEDHGPKTCNTCQQLAHNSTLEGIRTRMEKGVHQNSTFAYHGIGGLQEMLRRKNQQIEFYNLHSLNQARKLLGKVAALSDQKRLLMAISSGEVQHIDRVISIGLRQKKGARGILASVMAAAQGHYHPKSFTEEEDMKALLIWRLSGNRVAEINHRTSGAPSVAYLRTRSIVPPIIPSPSKPTVQEVNSNVKATLQSIMDEIHSIRTGKTNYFLGICREHAHKTSMEFINEGDMAELFQCIDDGDVHYAGEATIGTLGILCKDNRIYPGQPILVSGDCKHETGEEHAEVIETVIKGVDSEKGTTKLRIVCIASDGESRRGSAFIHLTFKHKLSPQSPLYAHLQHINFLNLYAGDDDLTCDKDWKHIFKRFRNLFICQRGVVIGDYCITPDIIRDHLKSEGLSAEHVRSLFNPDDQQDVKLAFDMLKDIWSLPRTSATNPNPGFATAREVLWMLGKLLFHMVYPYLCVDLSLSEQIEHLSAAAHLAIALYKLAGKDFIPTNLYIDLMIMIKNVIFCVAKAKVDNPDGEFWIILLGTDRLEELFGILRTMVGNDANLDILQLVSRLSGTTEISNILAKYPQWDQVPRCLKLPAIIDHIKPASWRGNVKVKDVSLQMSWNRGRRLVEDECLVLLPILQGLDEDENVDMLAPFGVLLFDVPLAQDDIDESLEHIPEMSTPTASLTTHSVDSGASAAAESGAIETRIEVEDVLGELAATDISIAEPQRRVVDSKILIHGKETSKARALSHFSKYRKRVGSTDRLRRVQDIERHVQNKTVKSNATSTSFPPPTDKADVLVISDPIATLVSSEDKIWLCIGEINGLRVDGERVPYVSLEMLSEPTVAISYQVLGVRPANINDDPENTHDWRTYRMPEQSFTVPGHLVHPLNPTTSKTHTPLQMPWYLFQGTFLIALAASLFQQLAASHLKSVPRFTRNNEFPYREASAMTKSWSTAAYPTVHSARHQSLSTCRKDSVC